MSGPWERYAQADEGPWKKYAAPESSAVGGAMDAVNTGVNWLGTQLTKGATGVLGAPSALGELGRQGAGYLGEKVGVPEAGRVAGALFKNMMTFGGVTPTTEGLNRAVFKDAGVPEVNAADNPNLMLKNPLGLGRDINAGAVLDAGVQAIPGMMMLPGAAQVAGGARAASVAVPAVAGGSASELAGQYAKDTPYEIPARLAGGLAGALLGSRAVTPLPARLTDEQARLVQIADKANVPLTVGQRTGRLRGVESALARFPTSAGQFANAADDQAVALNKLALSQMKAPEDITRLDPTSMTRAFSKASNEFEAAKNASGSIKLNPDFYQRVQKIGADYAESTPASSQIAAVARRVDDFFDPKLMKGGAYPELSGQQYQEFRRALNTAAQNTKSDPTARNALKDLRGALDDAMEASLPADKAERWRTVRKNWAALKTLSKATAGGSQDSRTAGNLSPNALTQALRQSQGVDRFATTEGGLNDVARLASYLADTRPNSGTPQTLMTQNMLSLGALAGGGGAGFLAGGIPGAAAVGVGLATPNALARAMTGSRGAGWLRDYLANQTMPNAYPQVGYRGLAETLARGSVPAVPRLENRP
jgi:hypothetical protein